MTTISEQAHWLQSVERCRASTSSCSLNGSVAGSLLTVKLVYCGWWCLVLPLLGLRSGIYFSGLSKLQLVPVVLWSSRLLQWPPARVLPLASPLQLNSHRRTVIIDVGILANQVHTSKALERVYEILTSLPGRGLQVQP